MDPGAGNSIVDAGGSASYSVGDAMGKLWELFRAGGKPMWVLLVLSIMSLAVVIERAVRLRRSDIVPVGLGEQADALWRAGRMDELDKLLEETPPSTLGKIIDFTRRYRHASNSDINAAGADIAGRDKNQHMMFTYPLAAIATLAPLLGLFGTIIGMISAFDRVAMAGAMGNPAMLSGSISQALVTTGFGLLVAIPTLFCYQLFRLRTNYLFNVLDEEASELINSWTMEGADETAPARKPNADAEPVAE
jgi:biopolymer transport protein ExbB